MKRPSRVVRPSGVLLVALCCVVVLTAAGFAAASAAGAAAASPVPASASAGTWTIALYANADNDLDYTWTKFTLPALQRIPPSAAVNVVAMVDREKKNGTWLYKVDGPAVSTVRHWSAEKDFGSGATFQWFLKEVHARFPSDHLIVVGWDHGYGWRYFSHDYHADHKITMPQLRKALAGAGVHVDVLAFDACNMADVEVAWDLGSVPDPATAGAPLVDYLVGSEETIDEQGYPYDDMFAPLAADPSRTPRQVTADMLRGWDTYYRSLRCYDWVSLSAVDMAAVRAGGAAMADLTARLRAGLAADPAKYGPAIREALATSISAWDSWQVDLAMFAGQLIAGHQLDADTGLLSAAVAVRDAVNGSMVLGVTSGSYARWFQGLTVWAGTGTDWKTYRAAYRSQSLFGAPAARGGVDWHALLRDYNGSGQASASKPVPRLPRATYGLTDVWFADATHGWATGYDNEVNQAVALRTTDGGQSWKTTRPSRGGAYSADAVTAAPGGELWLAGSAGWGGSLIAWSGDAGAAWRWVYTPSDTFLLGIDAVSTSTGLAAGTGGTLLKTTDRGRTWTQVAGAPPGDLFDLDFTSARDGWVVANDPVAMTGTVRSTTDGGATWATRATVPGAELYAVDVAGQDVWAAGGDPSAGGLLGGQRASGDGVLLHSGDGGATWATQWGGGAADPRLGDVDMLDGGVGWAVGDGSAAAKALILHTTDGGATWTPQDPGTITFDLAAVHAVDAQTAWVVGDGEQILKTTDGGATWTVQRGDVVGPVTSVRPARARRGRVATITYTVSDAHSPRARVKLTIKNARKKLVKSWDLGWQTCGDVVHEVLFRCMLAKGTYTVKALATDRAGNRQSKTISAKLRVR